MKKDCKYCGGTGKVQEKDYFCHDCEYYNQTVYCKMGVKTGLTINKRRCAYKQKIWKHYLKQTDLYYLYKNQATQTTETVGKVGA